MNTRSILIQVYNTTFVEADFAHGTALAFVLAAVTAVLGRVLRAGASEVDGMTTTLGMRVLKALAVTLIVVWSLAPIVLGVTTSLSTQREVNEGAQPLVSAPSHHPGLPRR